MSGLLRFVALGSLFALVSEFLFKFLATFNPGGFVIALAFWPLWVTFVFFSSKLLEVVLRNRLWIEIAVYLIYGLLGIAIEWNALGNSPSENPQASQITMFSIWASAAMAPRLLLSELEGMARLQRQMRIWFALYVAVSLVAVVFPHPFRALWVFVLAIPGYVVLNVFYFRYFAAVAKARS